MTVAELNLLASCEEETLNMDPEEIERLAFEQAHESRATLEYRLYCINKGINPETGRKYRKNSRFFKHKAKSKVARRKAA